jgi:2'-5' RNA ligase
MCRPMVLSESALVVLVPEAEALVKAFRDKYDPSAAAGMPAHITLIYPFKPPRELRADVLDTIHACFAGFVPFAYSLVAIRRFRSKVLYLAPEPDEPFRNLTLAICDCYPDRRPYGGKFAEVIPHLTVAHVQNEQDLDRIAEDFALAAAAMVPITASAKEVAIMDNSSGGWQIRDLFALGGIRR